MTDASRALTRLGFLIAFLAVGPARGALFHVEITPLPSGNAVMYFDLTNGDPAVDHSVVITDFASDGPAFVDPPVLNPASNITGTLAGEVTMFDGTEFQVTYSQAMTLGSYIRFDFTILGDPYPSDPNPADGFSFSLFSADGNPLITADGVLFLFNIGWDEPITTFSNDVQVTPVAEPSVLDLSIAGLLALSVGHLVGRRPRRCAVNR
jgi:hypothetical protein